MREVVVTGMGIVSSLGNNTSEVTDSLKNLSSGISENLDNKEIGLRSHVSGSIKNLDLKVQTRSTNNKISKNTEIYLVDTYGETKSFFKICKTVFLGGSLIKHGGQNPIEPARLGCNIIHGPNTVSYTHLTLPTTPYV